MYYHRTWPMASQGDDRRERPEANRRDHEALVDRGGAHGILVYAGSQPVGWCQYGRREELPRIDAGRNYRALGLPRTSKTLWRITCFFVDRNFRRQGVRRVALHGALDAIRSRGGGLVEAYPVTHRRAVPIWFGTVGLFERAGFRKVAALGRSGVLLRRRVRGSSDT